MEIEELKEAYVGLHKEFNTPGFDELNNIFDIGIFERNSGNLLRDIRRAMVEKVARYLRLLEFLLRPSPASPIFLVLLKGSRPADTQSLAQVFSAFIEIELASYHP